MNFVHYPAKVKIVVSHGGTGARGSGFLRAPVPLCEKKIDQYPHNISLAVYYPAGAKRVVSLGGTESQCFLFLRATVLLCEKNIDKKLTK